MFDTIQPGGLHHVMGPAVQHGGDMNTLQIMLDVIGQHGPVIADHTIQALSHIWEWTNT